ncbi:MAG: ABC transporter permease [Acidobacteria bacterium]|nr:ABC transporter permease [Acidobacteriota bacterium]
MIRYIAKRLALALITLVLVSLIVFVAAQILPGNIGQTILGHFATKAQVDAINAKLGLNGPILERYWHWISSFVQGNWGTSYSLQTPVFGLVMRDFLNSIMLGSFALILIVPISVGFGVLAALRHNTLVDRVISVTGMSMLALPEFVTGILILIVFGVQLHWFPVSSHVPTFSPISIVKNLLLPAIPEMVLIFGYVSRMARAGTVEVLESNYNRTAVLKGLPRARVLFRHTLRNSLLPTITVVAVQAGYLVGSLVVVETIFNYPGIGNLIYTSAVNHDQPVLQAAVFLVALVYTLSNLAADLLYATLNPRMRLD